MTNEEYREFLTVLSRRFVQPRSGRTRERFHHHLKEEWSYHLDQAERAARLAKFIENDCCEDGDVYSTVTPERLERAVSDTKSSVSFHNRIVEKAGFLEAIEAHAPEIYTGLRPEHLPEVDREVLRRIGSHDADAELAELVFRGIARGRRMERYANNEVSLEHDLRRVADRLDKAAQDFERIRESDHGKIVLEELPKKKSRRWFKGLGQIAQGAALSIANIAAATGALPFPVSPEIQTWGAMASVATGIGTILTGAGDLRGE